MNDLLAKCQCNDKEWECEEVKEKSTALCCPHMNHEASSFRFGHIVAQVLSGGKASNKKRGEGRPRLFLPHESLAYWMAANISFTWGVFSFFSAFASIWRIRSLVTERLCPTCSSVQA